MTTSEDTKYNGWTNYATWRVNLELADEYLSMQIEDVRAGYVDTFDDIAQLADNIKDYVENIVTDDDTTTSIAVDYAMAFLNDVNWYEIAENWTDELIAASDDAA
jgi:predicted RNA-binding protein Jag